jgi:uncharacterized protein
MKYQYRKQPSNKIWITFLFIGIVIGCFGTYYLYAYGVKPVEQVSTGNYNVVSNPLFSEAQVNLAAVDQDGRGITTPLVVKAKPGTGETLTNIDTLLFWTDTQQSIQTAKAVAENITMINTKNYDIIYSIESNASVVGGPSAGAALTIATIAALRNEIIRQDVMITGTINEDGTIGQVGGVLEKAAAAKDVGAMLFLVPKGQGEQTFLRPQENCTRRGNFLFCETTYKTETVNIGKDAGIAVIEVGSVSEAYRYFKL